MSLASQPSLQSSQTSSQSIPRLAEPFEPTSTGDTTPRTMADVEESFDSGKSSKKNKRGLFGFGKKKPEDIKEAALKSAPSKPAASTNSSTVAAAPARRSTASPVQTGEQNIIMTPSSPGRNLTSSPHLSSPAGSQIFERDVQESASVLMPNSPAIPSHIVTENYIPPALDASSEAITDDHLDPDSVEIITHTSHMPAAVTVTGVGISSPHPFGGSENGANLAASWADELASFAERDNTGLRGTDGASNYGSFDTTDVRRLSFISFADVVQAEHAGGYGPAPNSSRDSMHLAGLTSLASMNMANRSPSPIRSPVSSTGGGPGTSPPTSKSGSVKGLELSPSRNPNKSLASPTSPTYPIGLGGPLPTVSGEIAIETMRQALRRTGSSDLSAARSVPTSPVEGPSR